MVLFNLITFSTIWLQQQINQSVCSINGSTQHLLFLPQNRLRLLHCGAQQRWQRRSCVTTNPKTPSVWGRLRGDGADQRRLPARGQLGLSAPVITAHFTVKRRHQRRRRLSVAATGFRNDNEITQRGVQVEKEKKKKTPTTTTTARPAFINHPGK